MPIQRIDTIYDIEALKAEQAEYLNILLQSKEAIIELNKQRVTAKGADISSFTKAATDLDAAIKKTSATTEIGIKENARMQESIKAVTNTINARFATEAKLATLQTDYNKQTVANRAEIQKTNKELKAQAEAEQAVIGSRDRALAQIKVLTHEKNKLNLINADEKKQYDEIVVKLQRYEKFLKDTGSTAEKQRLNIGNYSGAVAVLKKSFDEVALKMGELSKAGKTNTDVFKQLEKEYQLLNKLVNTQEAGFANATMEIRANQKALLDLEQAGLAGTESFKALEKQTGELQDQLSDLKARTKQLGSDTFVFDGLISAAQGLAGAYGAAQGVAALFGDENEDLQKTMAKLQATMGIIQGLQAIQNTLQAESAGMLLLQDIRTKALAISQGVYSIAVGTSTGALRLFRIALLATGIGAIIGLLYLAADAMGVFGDSTSETTEDLEAQAEAAEKTKKSLEDISKSAEEERNRRAGGLNDLKRELELAQARGDSEEKIQKIKDEIHAKERLNLLTEFESFRGYAAKQNEINEKGKDLNNKFEAEKLAAAKKRQDDIDKREKEAADKRAKQREKERQEAIKFAEDEAKATFNIFKDNADERARIAQLSADDESAPLQERLDALTTYFQERSNLIGAQKRFDLKDVKDGSKQEQDIINKAQIEQNKLYQEVWERRKEITKSGEAKVLAEEKDAHDKQLQELDAQTNRIRDADEKAYNDKIIALNERFEQGLITQSQYEEQRKKLDEKYHIDSLKNEVDYQKKLIKLSKLTTDEKAAALKALSQLEKEISDASVKTAEDEAAAKKAAAAKLFSDISSYANQGFSIVSGIAEVSATNTKNRLKEESDAAEQRAAKEIELVNASTDSEEKKAARITIINETLAAQKNTIDQKARQADLQKARFDKAAAIANIIINTAAAVVKALPNIPLSVLVGVLGAAQLAVAIATPLPKYKHGRGTGRQELAIVGDGGVSEFIHRSSGRIEKTPAVETLAHLMPGDKVYPNKATMMRELAMAAIPVISQQVDKGLTREDMREMTGNIVEAVGEIKIQTQLITKDGWRQHNKNLADYDSWVKRYIKG